MSSEIAFNKEYNKKLLVLKVMYKTYSPLNLVKNEVAHDCHPGEGCQEEIHVTVTKNNTSPISVVDVHKKFLTDDQIEECH